MPTREYTKDMVKAFERIGCPMTAKMCRRAIALLGVEDPSDFDAKGEASLDVFDDEPRLEELNALHDEYYAGAEEPIAPVD